MKYELRVYRNGNLLKRFKNINVTSIRCIKNVLMFSCREPSGNERKYVVLDIYTEFNIFKMKEDE